MICDLAYATIGTCDPLAIVFNIFFWPLCVFGVIAAMIEKEDSDGDEDSGDDTDSRTDVRHTSDLPLRRVRS